MELSIKKFSEIGIKDVGIVGGKNAALGEMYSNLTQLGVNIPDGFAFRSKTSYLDLNSYKPKMNTGVSFTSSVYFYKGNTYDWDCNIEGIKPYKILNTILKKNK